MLGILGTRASIEFEINFLLQLVIFLLLLVGYWFVKSKKRNGFKIHERIMTIVVLLNGISILFIMGPVFFKYFNAVLSEALTLGFPLTLLHHSFGLVAEALGIIQLFRKFGNVRTMMKLTFLLWIIALIMGISFFVQYYII